MILLCTKCGTRLKYYDRVSRMVRIKNRSIERIIVPRYKCCHCNSTHRILPDKLYPYKQYNSEIINGVVQGYITENTLGYEDYPCEMTMKRWKKETLRNKNINLHYVKK